jgi:hypothetical protein
MRLEQFEHKLARAGLGMLRAEMEAEVFGVGGHGSDYQRARQIFLRRLADDPNQPAHVRGWIRQELTRLTRAARAAAEGRQPPGGSATRVRGVGGFDVGHGLGRAGLHNPDWFRLERPADNRSRPARARRLGLGRRYYES